MQTEAIRHRLKGWYISLCHWEYWPMWLVYLPVSFYYLYLSCRAKTPFFFSASNPSIETGGMFFESKWSIFQLIPEAYFPKTIYVDAQDSPEAILQKIQIAQLTFPFIAKPDRGERGWGVKIINTPEELAQYKIQANIAFLIQAYVNYPLEFSIFYYRNPKESKGKITSVTLKKLLSVTGDGISTIDALIKKDDRAFLQYDKLKKEKLIDFEYVPKKAEEKLLVPYGNHVRGAKFLNYNHIIDGQLNHTFDEISNKIEGFYFGRFDLRCTSIKDMKAGKNIAILELNGAGAEPGHIYDPSYSYFKAQFVLAKHYKMMYEAATENNKKGVAYMTYRSFKEVRKQEKQFKKKVIFS